MKNVVAFSPICGSQKKLVLLLMQCLLGNVIVGTYARSIKNGVFERKLWLIMRRTVIFNHKEVKGNTILSIRNLEDVKALKGSKEAVMRAVMGDGTRRDEYVTRKTNKPFYYHLTH